MLIMSETTENTQSVHKIPLIQARSMARLSQRKLAKAAGLSETSYIDIEKGRVRPRYVNAYAIVESLNDALTARGKEGNLTIDSIEWKPLGEAE